MRRFVSAFLVIWLSLAMAARAEELPVIPAVLGDALYKGVVGKALDAVPMAPAHRVAVQRTNAVVSSTLTGRSLAVWLGLAHPVLAMIGLAWGVFAASRITAAETGPKPGSNAVEPDEPALASQDQVALASSTAQE